MCSLLPLLRKLWSNIGTNMTECSYLSQQSEMCCIWFVDIHVMLAMYAIILLPIFCAVIGKCWCMVTTGTGAASDECRQLGGVLHLMHSWEVLHLMHADNWDMCCIWCMLTTGTCCIWCMLTTGTGAASDACWQLGQVLHLMHALNWDRYCIGCMLTCQNAQIWHSNEMIYWWIEVLETDILSLMIWLDVHDKTKTKATWTCFHYFDQVLIYSFDLILWP